MIFSMCPTPSISLASTDDWVYEQSVRVWQRKCARRTPKMSEIVMWERSAERILLHFITRNIFDEMIGLMCLLLLCASVGGQWTFGQQQQLCHEIHSNRTKTSLTVCSRIGQKLRHNTHWTYYTQCWWMLDVQCHARVRPSHSIKTHRTRDGFFFRLFSPFFCCCSTFDTQFLLLCCLI